ncbi:hypothetical protein evm_015291 [Chilo suppressalis]|nr:hypothetical protein evm_015291 [Chilo suppressalis]
MYVREVCNSYCYKPRSRRLALFSVKDGYECYANGYIKCFWGMCDHHKSIESFVTKANDEGKLPNKNLATQIASCVLKCYFKRGRAVDFPLELKQPPPYKRSQ